MISPLMEDAIRRIVRDEIAQDEMRRIEQERRGARSAMVPGKSPPPGTIFCGLDVTSDEATAVAISYASKRAWLLDFDPDRLEALDQELRA